MSYIVRIELDSNIMADFNVLHEEMRAHGFSRTIRSTDSKEYYLPRATYLINTNLSRSQVLENTKIAVSKTFKNAEIIVIEYVGCSWSGLKPVK
jgi:hypothetical protein